MLSCAEYSNSLWKNSAYSEESMFKIMDTLKKSGADLAATLSANWGAKNKRMGEHAVQFTNHKTGSNFADMVNNSSACAWAVWERIAPSRRGSLVETNYMKQFGAGCTNPLTPRRHPRIYAGIFASILDIAEYWEIP